MLCITVVTYSTHLLATIQCHCYLPRGRGGRAWRQRRGEGREGRRVDGHGRARGPQHAPHTTLCLRDAPCTLLCPPQFSRPTNSTREGAGGQQQRWVCPNVLRFSTLRVPPRERGEADSGVTAIPTHTQNHRRWAWRCVWCGTSSSRSTTSTAAIIIRNTRASRRRAKGR